MNFEDAFIDEKARLPRLIEALGLTLCQCQYCNLHRNSIIKWYCIPGTDYSVTYFGLFIFSKNYYPNTCYIGHSNYTKLEDVLENCPQEIQEAIVFNLDIITKRDILS